MTLVRRFYDLQSHNNNYRFELNLIRKSSNPTSNSSIGSVDNFRASFECGAYLYRGRNHIVFDSDPVFISSMQALQTAKSFILSVGTLQLFQL